jgi:AcrR family transcriptional regulator
MADASAVVMADASAVVMAMALGLVLDIGLPSGDDYWNDVPVTGTTLNHRERKSSGRPRSVSGSPTLRERKAQLTRDEILTAARRLFAEYGYAGTTVRDIAKEAGVSAQTVYDSIGSKQALVARLNDLIDSEANVAGLAAEAMRSTDPAFVAALSSRITTAILRHCTDILRALTTGAASEPELSAAMEEGHRRHVTGARVVVTRLSELDALGPPIDEAADTLAAVSDVRLALLLREAYGWSLEHIETWIADTSRALLLAPAVPKPRRTRGPRSG